jgi:hypothetical protein
MAATTASIIVPLFSPAGAADWATHFLAYATELDATGFPRSGSFGFGFHCYTDLSVAATAASRRTAAEAAILETYTRLGQVLTPTELGSKVRQVCTAYEELHLGCIVAFKKGVSVVAIARITSAYRYEPDHEGTTTAIHRWDYEILQKLPMKIPLPGRNATYYSNGYLYTPPAPVAAPAFNVPEDAAEPAAAGSLRITDRAIAEAHIGRVCTYNTADGVEYGRITRATQTMVILDRLQQTADGAFIPHPVPVCPSSRNSVGYTRDIRLVPEDAAAPAPRFNVPEDAEPPAPAPTFNVPEDAEPAAHRIAALEAENARLGDRLAAALALIHALTATT